jgi:dipeptidyl aminopeptidase/acylaminoacyl peptidase
MHYKSVTHWFSMLSMTLIVLLLAGCAGPGAAPTAIVGPATAAPTGVTPGATAVPATEPATQPPTEPATQPPPAATSTVPANSAVMPAPVYFISFADGQLWRVERDGTTLTQITNEAAAVTYYDISPADGSLAYVSANTLVLADADGGSARRLFSGPQDYSEDMAINNEIVNLSWSPDGQQLAFGYGGIQILDMASPMLTPNVLIPSDPVPDPAGGRQTGLLRFYRQALWSPDGTRLLVEYLHYPEGNGWALVLMNTDAGLQDVDPPAEGGILCCEPTWSLDGQYVYFASPYVGMGSPGLRRVTVATGQTETLIAPVGDAGNETFYMIEKAQQLADGDLYYFMGTEQGFPTGSFTPLTMHRAGRDGSNATALRQDSHMLEEVLWAPDASGALIMEVGPDPSWPLHGPLTWLPADGSAAVRLPADGTQLSWGQ